jgi:hypothetical protein
MLVGPTLRTRSLFVPQPAPGAARGIHWDPVVSLLRIGGGLRHVLVCGERARSD